MSAAGVISLNITWYSWEKARHAFHQKVEDLPDHLNNSSHDAFAGHLLMVHRLKCSECKAKAGARGEREHGEEGVPTLPALNHAAHRHDRAVKETQTEPAPEPAEQPELRVSHKTLDAETQTPPENENLSTIVNVSSVPDPAPRLENDQKPVAVTVSDDSQGKGSVEDKTHRRGCDERQSSSPSVNGPLTMQQDVGYPLFMQQRRLHRDIRGRLVSGEAGRKKITREKYWQRKRRERKRMKEQQDLLDAPRKKKEKTSVPKEKQPIIEPRKSERIKQRIESQANSLQKCVTSTPASTPPATTSRDDGDDGWIEDEPDAKNFEGLKEGETSAGSTFKSTSDLRDINKKDADGLHIPVTKSMRSSNFEPCNGLSDYLEPSNSRDADNPAGLQFGVSRWSMKLSPVTIPKFQGPSPGPTTKLSTQHQEITFFHLLFPPELIEHLVVNSNYFAEQLLTTVPSVVRCSPFTVDEMKAFLALQLLMSVNRIPDLSSYWSKECSFGGVNVSDVMSEDRFKAFLVYFQPCKCSLQSDNRSGCNCIGSKGCKILNIISDCCRLQYSPHRDCSVHETTLYEGKKNRIHVCLLVDSANGYCSEFQVCPSLKEVRDHCQSRNSIVIDLTHRLQKKNYIVNLSESFANLELLTTLEANGILCRGAITKSHQKMLSLPNELFSRSIYHNMTFQQGNITAYSWYSKVCRRQVISSADDHRIAYEVRETHNGKSTISRCPKAVVHHMKSLYAKPFNNPCPTQGRSLRRNQCIFWFAFDVVIANAFILKHGSGCTLEGMKSFRKSLALQLIKSNSQQGDFQPSIVRSGVDTQPVSLYSDRGLCHTQPAKPSDSMSMHSQRATENIQPTRLSDGINVQCAQQSDSTIDGAHFAGPTYDNGMQTQAIHSGNSDVNIQISRVTSGFGMPSYTLHSDNTNEHVEPPHSNDGFDMHSPSQHSESTDLNIRISKVTGGIGMQSQTLHSSSTSDSFSSVRLTDTQSQAMHSDNTSEDVKPLLSSDGTCVSMQSHSLHSSSTSGNMQPIRLIDDLDMQSQALPSDNTGEDIKPLLSNDGISVHPHSLHSDGTSDNALCARLSDDLDMQSQTLHLANTNNLHSAVPTDDTGLQSPSCSSQVQHTKTVHSRYDIAKKIKVEPRN